MQVEIAVVGAGLAGLAGGWRLLGQGRDALVLERHDAEHDRGSSHGATRIFRYAYEDPIYVRMAQHARALWRELGEDLITFTGGFDVDEPPRLDRIEAALGSAGAASERLDADALVARIPWFDPQDRGAVWSPDYGVIAAARVLATLREHVGERLLQRCPATIARIDDDGVTLGTPRGTVRARVCIVSAGAWAAPIAADAGASLPLRVTREQVSYFQPVDPGAGGHPYIDGRMYLVPGLHDAPGVKVAEHGAGPRAHPDALGAIDPEAASRAAAYVRRHLPGLHPEPVAHETCLYTSTPDEDFVLARLGPVVIISACSGHGFKFGPLTGEIAAALATGREPPVPLDRFGIARW